MVAVADRPGIQRGGRGGIARIGARQAEVEHLYVEPARRPRRQPHIVRLQVAVHQAGGVRSIDRSTDLLEHGVTHGHGSPTPPTSVPLSG